MAIRSSSTIIAFPFGGHETGIVQVFWQQLQNNPTFAPADVPPAPAGDVNTHLLIFNNGSGNPNEMANFLDYLDPGAANGGITPTPDFYSGVDDSGASFTFSADPNSPNYAPVVDTQMITVQVGTPEPSMIALGGVVFGLGMLRRRRSR